MYNGMVMSVRVSIRQSQFSALSWNFACYFLLMNSRSCSSGVNFRQFLELCTFWNFESQKYTVFRTFFLYVLTNCDEIWHMPLLYCTTDQLSVSSICVDVCTSYALFGRHKEGDLTQYYKIKPYTNRKFENQWTTQKRHQKLRLHNDCWPT